MQIVTSPLSYAGPVAIMMCVYDGDKPALLDRALRSILEQRYHGEKRIYLCVDGPVSDQMSRTIATHQAQIYHLTYNTTNIGLASSLNKLIASLSNEAYVFRMDADDYSLPERFVETLSFMESEGVDVCGSWIAEIHADRHTRQVVRFPRDHITAIRTLVFGSPFAHPTVCFRREVLLKCRAYPLKRSNEDIAFWFLLAKADYRFGNVQKVLLEYTINNQFFRRRARGKAFEELKIYLHGIYKLRGLSVTLLIPFARFLLRLLPEKLVQRAYNMRWFIGR